MRSLGHGTAAELRDWAADVRSERRDLCEVARGACRRSRLIGEELVRVPIESTNAPNRRDGAVWDRPI